MSDLSSQLRKVGIWIWNQKEKMFLGALLIVLCFRVYVVLAGVNPATTPDPPKDNPPPPANKQEVLDPTPRPMTARAEDFKPLVRQNPFTIYSMAAQGQGGSETESDTIDVTLNSIMKWSDGTYRADLTTKVTGKSKRYKEGEVFENYKLLKIDPANKSVQIYSSAHDKTFELKLQ